MGKGKPRVNALPEEQELHRLLDCLGQVRQVPPIPSYPFALYNPRVLIRAVNALFPLGKEKALAVIDEFLRVHRLDDDDGIQLDYYAEYQLDDGEYEGVLLVLHTLFDVPETRGHSRLPRFPITIEGDIPLLFTEGGYGASKGQCPRPGRMYGPS